MIFVLGDRNGVRIWGWEDLSLASSSIPNPPPTTTVVAAKKTKKTHESINNRLALKLQKVAKTKIEYDAHRAHRVRH
ncbi:hypothetical protein V6N13_039626 [Hibiscus sabdariffa]|uniref:Uncharacterized protein n=1 Tax=Hibiscus sabdariffa TaxID=183260 RepID=A0ABR2SV01_9ROSI